MLWLVLWIGRVLCHQLEWSVWFWFYNTHGTRSIHHYSNMAPRLSGQTSIFGVVFLYPGLFWEFRDKRKPRSHVRILMFRTRPIENRSKLSKKSSLSLDWVFGTFHSLLLIKQPFVVTPLHKLCKLAVYSIFVLQWNIKKRWHVYSRVCIKILHCVSFFQFRVHK